MIRVRFSCTRISLHTLSYTKSCVHTTEPERPSTWHLMTLSIILFILQNLNI
ncbi:hypothetical protein Hanom_Chr04g00353381 [Helianthus anomalus]